MATKIAYNAVVCHPLPMPYAVRTVSEASIDDVQAVLGPRGRACDCQCQRFRLDLTDTMSVDDRRDLLCGQITEGHGVLAFADDDPVGWCSVAPRREFGYLGRTTWKGRAEDRNDPDVWAITCFMVRPDSRNRGVGRALIDGAVDLARAAGARTVEAYPMTPRTESDDDPGELHVGVLSSFLDAGFRIVQTPSLHRAVVRYDF